MSTVIPTCGADEDPDVMYAILREAGCLVLRDMMSPESIAAARVELSPHMDAADAGDDDPEAFYPGKTHRVVALMDRSEVMRDLMMDHRVERLCDRHLLPNCTKWQLNVSAALEVGPGARDQVLHREEDLFPYFTPPRPNLVLATMWAMSDFTADNGGTQIVPGSHRWDADRVAEPDEVVRAEMPAGSTLVWLGGTLHGAGANSARLRHGLRGLARVLRHVGPPAAEVLKRPGSPRAHCPWPQHRRTPSPPAAVGALT